MISASPSDLHVSTNVISFSNPIGATVPISAETTPLELFESFFDQEIVDHIVSHTNIYASQRKTVLIRWQNCTTERLKSFLGMIIAMGVKRMPNLRDYWSSNSILGCPEIVSN